MKALLLILCLSTVGVAQSKLGVSSSYDRFKDETTTQVIESLVPDRPGYVLFSLIAVSKGSVIKRPHSVGITITSVTDDWYFLGGPTTLRVIQDDKRYEIGEMKRVSSDVIREGVIEQLLIQVPLSTALKLGQARKLEFQVGRYETELKPEQIANLKRWANSFPANP